MEASLYDVILFEDNIMISMRDGIRLATDIYRPAKNGKLIEEKLPIILQRTPYDKRSRRLAVRSGEIAARYFVQRGYIYVIQDARGRYESEGSFSKYMDGIEDGYDTLEWLANLSYTNGKIGMWGLSAGATSSANAAQSGSSHIKTVSLNCGGLNNAWEQKVLYFGVFELGQQLVWAFNISRQETRDPLVMNYLDNEKAADWVLSLPLKRGLSPLAVVPEFENYFLDFMERTDYDDFWGKRELNWSECFDETADIPMMHISGWYDSFTSSTINNYQGLSKIKKSPMSLIIGPWTHGGNNLSFAGDVEFGPEAAIPVFYNKFHLDWFDYWLKDKKNRFARQPNSRIFVMGTGKGYKDENGRLFHGGYWRDIEKWPFPETEHICFYFYEDGSLRKDPPTLYGEKTIFTYDPRNPVPTIGGSFSNQEGFMMAGGYNQREREFKGDAREGFLGSKPPYLPLRARNDVVVFQTDILEEDVEVIGPVTVKLYASSTALDTDFTAKLIDVYPPSADYPTGYDLNITDGITRARYRESREKQVLMEPGEVYELTIEPFPTANVFKKGHRIRVDISSSNFPRFEPNPNTGEAISKSRRVIVADNTVYHNNLQPSHMVLPIIKK